MLGAMIKINPNSPKEDNRCTATQQIFHLMEPKDLLMCSQDHILRQKNPVHTLTLFTTTLILSSCLWLYLPSGLVPSRLPI
jgi:hypothetical protein